MVKINLNNEVHFELTEYGKSIYKKHIDDSNLLYDLKTICEYPSTLLLWEFMEIFGHSMWHGNQAICTVNNSLSFDKETLVYE